MKLAFDSSIPVAGFLGRANVMYSMTFRLDC